MPSTNSNRDTQETPSVKKRDNLFWVLMPLWLVASLLDVAATVIFGLFSNWLYDIFKRLTGEVSRLETAWREKLPPFRNEEPILGCGFLVIFALMILAYFLLGQPRLLTQGNIDAIKATDRIQVQNIVTNMYEETVSFIQTSDAQEGQTQVAMTLAAIHETQTAEAMETTDQIAVAPVTQTAVAIGETSTVQFIETAVSANQTATRIAVNETATQSYLDGLATTLPTSEFVLEQTSAAIEVANNALATEQARIESFYTLTPSLTPQPTATPEPCLLRVRANSPGANLRDQPGTDGEILRALNIRETVLVIHGDRPNWLYVSVGRDEGYVSSNLLMDAFPSYPGCEQYGFD